MLADKNSCTGCGTCAASCHLNCITMQTDQEGFRYPEINTSCCVSCRKCEAACPVLNKFPAQEVHQAYGVKHKDDHIRNGSSSGGVFPALASFALNNGGAVCGAVYTDTFNVEHRLIEDVSEIPKMQGAKYTQSCTEHLFRQMRNILEEGRWLLFIGTPCQTAGFRKYLGKKYDKLILVDMICHGVPSPVAWKKYLEHRIEKDSKNSGIAAINQRDKSSGWSRYRYSMRIDYKNGSTYCVPQYQDPYMRGFVNNLYLRPSCAQCSFKGTERCADITLGDYWGVWEQHPEFDDDRGVSLVMVNTEKGLYFWNRIRDNLEVLPVSNPEALTHNQSAQKSSPEHPKRSEFFTRVKNADFDKLVGELLSGVPEKKRPIRELIRKLIKI